MELEDLNLGELCVHYKVCRIKPCHAHCDEYLPKDDYAAKRPHAKWILTDNQNYSPFDGSSDKTKICSQCGYSYYTKEVFTFCPKCGAIMWLG